MPKAIIPSTMSITGNCEHSLQLGITEVYTMTQDEALKDKLCRHLVQDHLLTPVTKPESEQLSQSNFKGTFFEM